MRERGLQARRLNTRLAIMPWLLMVSGMSLAGGLPPLTVSPDLIRSPAVRAQPPAVQPVVQPGAVAVSVEERTLAPQPPRPSEVSPASREEALPAASRSEPQAEATDRRSARQPGGVPVTSATEELEAPSAPTAAAVPAVAPASAPALAVSESAINRTSPGSTEVSALRIVGVRTVELVAEGEAELIRDGRVLTADRVIYNELTDRATADGNVRIADGADWLTGQWASVVVHEWVGEIDQPRYSFSRQSEADLGEAPRVVVGTGGASTVFLEGENQYRMTDATWTTCEPDSPDWFVRADELALDYDQNIGIARGARLVFMDRSVLWWPKMTFPLAEQRQSGFLAPTLGVSNRNGVDVAVPYYWNIAPNYDATITPRFMGRRGLQLGGEYRYLTANYSGDVRGEWMPRDREAGESRSMGSLRHQHRLGDRTTGSLDYNWVSDKRYFEDLSSRIAIASRVNLLREAQVTHHGSWWTAHALLQGYQTLDGAEPYRRLPQIRLTARRADLPAGLNFAFEGEYVNFRHENQLNPEGHRTHLQPQFSLPLAGQAYFVTPSLSLLYTRYDLNRNQPGASTSIRRTVPVFSLDAGLFMERDTEVFGNEYLQTLEPRLFYVRIPRRDQASIPVFDTSRYDFGFAQLFSENRYSGVDRIGDANEFTAALTTRYIEQSSGVERLRATVGQRFYLDDHDVILPGEKVRANKRTDILAELSGRLTQAVSMNSLWRYDPFDGATQRFNLALRYNPEFGKVANLGYRYLRDEPGIPGFKDVDLSGQWPLGGRWYGVGRITRSIRDNRVTEALAGLEYLSQCGCWAFRTAAHRFATDRDRVTNALFFQIEFNGLGSIGPSPVNLLTRSVPGYGKINESVSSRVFGPVE